MDNGFARVRCGACHAEYLVVLSCKGPGLCPSCAAKGAATLAAFLRVEIILFAKLLGAVSSAADYASSARRSRWWRNFDSAA